MESYRGWRLQGGHLWSANNDTLWESPTLTAVCRHGCEAGVCIANHDCTCGIYSRKDLKHLLQEYNSLAIYGIVYNHGVVFEGQTGLRAEKVTIRALFTADFHTGKVLEQNYPGVAILMPPPEILALGKTRESHDNWQLRYQRTRQRLQQRAMAVEAAKLKYPGGPDAEKIRLMALLKGANRQTIIDFAKEYTSDDEWAARLWQGHIEKHTKKAKPGDMVFEANDDTHPYVFIGSTRPNPQASMRFLFDRNGILVKRPNIRRWDEEPGLMKARQQAIEEWE